MPCIHFKMLMFGNIHAKELFVLYKLVDSFNCIFWRRIIWNRHNIFKKERKRDKKTFVFWWFLEINHFSQFSKLSWNLFDVFVLSVCLMRSANSPFTRSVCLKLWIVCKNYFHKHKIRTLWKIESMNIEQAYDHENENPLVQILPGIIRNLSKCYKRPLMR